MDRHRRSNHREHRESAKDASDHCKRESARPSRADNEYQAFKEGRLIPKQDSIRGNRSQEALANQLSGDDDYVRRWLAQTDEEANQKKSGFREARQRSPNRSEPKTHVEVGVHYPALEDELRGVPSWRKRKHNTSSDSSLLEAPFGPKPKWQPRTISHLQTGYPAREEEPAQPRKKQKTKNSVSGTSASSISLTPKKETFEKRARHKTREDRYEPKEKVKKCRNDEECKRPRKKREKKGDRKRAAKKAGEDLMRNFSSKSIGQNRLTIHPSHGLGLFKNGRASSPVQRRGIPDLAFSEMDFLQRSNRHLSSTKEDKVNSKSREKEKRKAARAQDEISTFFKPKKMPLQPIDWNKGNEPSPKHPEDRSEYINRVQLDFLQRYHEPSQPFDVPKKPNIGSGRNGPSDILSASLNHSHLTSNPNNNVSDSGSKLSGRAMTYISWSESQISRGATSRDLSKVGRTQASPTPESVRRSLENTGIFRDTGISMSARRAAVPSDDHERSSKQGGRRASETSARTPDTPESTKRVVTRARTRSAELSCPHSRHRPDPQEEAEVSNTKDILAQVGDKATKRERIIIEHFDPNSGWHERLTANGQGQSVPTMSTKTELPEQRKSVPINREEIAKFARIKRPSTALPLAQTSLARDGRIVERTQDTRIQTDIPVEQAENHRTSAKNMVEEDSTPRPDSLRWESGNQASAKTKSNEPCQSGVLPHHHHHHGIEDKPASGLVRTGQEPAAVSPFLAVIHVEPSPEDSFMLRNGIDNFHNTSSSYLGLSARGFPTGRGPLQTTHHTNSSPVAGREPYFIHQLQRQSASFKLSDYEDHFIDTQQEEANLLANSGATTQVEGFQYNDVPEEDEFGYFYVPTDDYIDSALQQTYEYSEDPSGGHDDAELWQLNSPRIGREDYDLEELGHGDYEQEQVMGDLQNWQQFVHDSAPVVEEDYYGPYGLARDDHMQVFWRPHRQY